MYPQHRSQLTMLNTPVAIVHEHDKAECPAPRSAHTLVELVRV